MTIITRRAALAGIASIPAAAGAGAALTAPSAPPTAIPTLIDALHAATVAYEAAVDIDCRAEEQWEKNQPEIFVPLPFGRGRAILNDAGPADRASAEQAIERELATTRNMLAALALRFGPEAMASMSASLEREETRIAAELEAAKDRRAEAMAACGYAAAIQGRQAALCAEEDALRALIAAPPRDLAEAGLKARVLADYLETTDSDVHVAMLASLLGNAS